MPLSLPPNPDAGDIASFAANGAATAGSILAGLASPSIGLIAPYFALAGPIGMAIAGLTAVGLGIAKIFSGCGQTCVVASNYANQVEQVLQDNLMHYLNSPVHYKSLQQAALVNFDTAWTALERACGQASLGAAGQRCTSDRQAGACHFHSADGACWNWFIGYRDPISNDTSVVPDPRPNQPPSVTGVADKGTGAGTGTGAGVPSTDDTSVLYAGVGVVLLLAVWKHRRAA